MALTRGRTLVIVLAAIALAGALAYLRDPPWLINVSSGLAPARMGRDGVRFRPMSGRGSFFVPADAESVTVPVRAPFRSPADWPIAATFFVDDRPVQRIVLADGSWQRVTIALRRPTRRRVRRVEIHADRTRTWNHGLDIGDIELSR